MSGIKFYKYIVNFRNHVNIEGNESSNFITCPESVANMLDMTLNSGCNGNVMDGMSYPNYLIHSYNSSCASTQYTFTSKYCIKRLKFDILLPTNCNWTFLQFSFVPGTVKKLYGEIPNFYFQQMLTMYF